jgi:manganese transport protein
MNDIKTGAAEVKPLPTAGWRSEKQLPSLPEVFRTIHVPINSTAWKRFLAFFGPGYLIAVGYMDPGNWATDIQGGAVYKYQLLSVILVANFTAIFLQALAAKLGIVTGRDLAQACRDSYSRWIVISLWISAEIAIVACDIAEVIGAGIALYLLFHIPLIVGCSVTSLDVLIVLALQGRGFRWIETLVITLIGSMMVIFAFEMVYAHPNWVGAAAGLIPKPEIVKDPAMLYVALGILGATVMPHNLYLHSSIIQTRSFGNSVKEIKGAIKAAYTDSTLALMLALFVNAAILILAAAAFYRTGHHEVADIQTAYKLLTPLLVLQRRFQ